MCAKKSIPQHSVSNTMRDGICHNAPLPELGPSIVFFSGGTALRELSQALCSYTHNTVHLLTPFDSGGSSAALRNAFGIPAVGDIRNRMLALAHPMIPEDVIHLCAMRLPELSTQHTREFLLQNIQDLASEEHACWQQMPRIFAENLRLHVQYFLQKMPKNFDPSRASIGNLVLAGGYLHNKRQWGPTLALFTRLLRLRGIIMPTSTKSVHLAAELKSGQILWGQHTITGQQLAEPVRRLFFIAHKVLHAQLEKNADVYAQDFVEVTPKIQPQAATAIGAADAICFPMGSFYTSVVANIIVKGTGKAIACAHCPKLYIPNMGYDKEQHGLSVADAVAVLLKALRKDAGAVPTHKLLQHVLVDEKYGHYPYGIDVEGLTAQGVQLCSKPMAEKNNGARHDAMRTASALMDILSEANNYDKLS